MEHPTLTFAELNKGFIISIEIVAKDGEEEYVGRALEALVGPTMAEPGIKLFLPYRSPTNPKAFFIFELYHSENGRAEHETTIHFKEFVEKTLPRIANRKLAPYVPFSAG
jgi:quinol monooxygenase YgiN